MAIRVVEAWAASMPMIFSGFSLGAAWEAWGAWGEWAADRRGEEVNRILSDSDDTIFVFTRFLSFYP